MVDYLYVENLVREAGNLMKISLNESQIHVKGLADFVTDKDMEVEQFVYEGLHVKYPEIGFLGEESNVATEENETMQWILDPIDGTTNYIYGYNMSAISLALKCEDEIVFGIVYNPFTNELFQAVKGQGAYLNGKRMHVSAKKCIQESLVAFGTSPYEKERAPKVFELVRKVYEQSLDIRRTGSAALDLAYLACGRQDAFFEYNLKAWDIAAGCLLIQEAGGVVRTIANGSIVHGKNNDILACCNDMVLQDMLKILPE